MKNLFLLFVLALPLNACAQASVSSSEMPPVATMPAPSDKTCQLPTSLVGKPEKVLHTMRFGNVVRFIHPGDSVTADYSSQRTNIEINDKGIISRVYCG